MRKRRRALSSGSTFLGGTAQQWVCAELAVFGLVLLVLGISWPWRVGGLACLACAVAIFPLGSRSAVGRFADRLTFGLSVSDAGRVGATVPQRHEDGEFWQEPEAGEAFVPVKGLTWGALFPGAEVADVTDARGRTCGFVSFDGLTSVCFTASPGREVDGLALGALCDALVGAQVALHSVVWATNPPVLAPPEQLGGALQREAIEAGYALQWPARVVVRFTDEQVHEAAILRGGGHPGRAAALTAATSAVGRALQTCGWASRVLDGAAIVREVERSLGTPDEGVVDAWSQSWSSVHVGTRHHRCVGLEEWGTGTSFSAVMHAVADVGVEFAVEAFDIAQDRPVRILARLHSDDESALGRSVSSLSRRSSTRTRWEVLDGSHLEGLHATTVVGAGDD